MTDSPDGERSAVPAVHYARVDPSIRAVVSQDDEFSVAADQYRNLAFRIEEEARVKPLSGFVLAVTSPEPGAGKTLVSLNLALTLARGDGKILLIEGDLRRPTLETYVQNFVVAGPDEERPLSKSGPPRYGLWHVLARHLTLAEATLPVWGTQLEILFAGTRGHVDNVMAQQGMSQVLGLARSRYKIVVMDSAPLILAAGRSASARANSTLLVLRAGRTRRQQASAALSLVNESKLLGMVLNGVKIQGAAYGSYQRGAVEFAEHADEDEEVETKEPSRPFMVKIGLALIVTILLAGVLGQRRLAGSSPFEADASADVVISESVDWAEPDPLRTIETKDYSAAEESTAVRDRIDGESLFETSTLSQLNLRTEPRLDASRILTLGVGERLLALEVRGEWLRVRGRKNEGWVHHSGLIPESGGQNEGQRVGDASNLEEFLER